jgi:hypothetical protein
MKEIRLFLESGSCGQKTRNFIHVINSLNTLSSYSKRLKTKVNKIVILSGSLCECENWCLSFVEGLKVFENKAVVSMFASKKEEVTSLRIQLYNDKLH